ncbi:hypothetical protein BD779DRAFT_1803938 [Infundibulicybe gibba]|nr:hypothetical protein BD779DRAFT_1803938 [Infundibulicybe gibba]
MPTEPYGTMNMHQVMREDARWRFTFGITIEDTSTRFWFASRSVVLKPSPLIRMVKFLLHASEEQLGYDMTMGRNQSQLAVDLGSSLGRGTRVWSGFFTDDLERELAVLKDCWAECDRELEGDVLATLREKYAKLNDASKPNLNDYFLTVTVAHRQKVVVEIWFYRAQPSSVVGHGKTRLTPVVGCHPRPLRRRGHG